MHIWINSVDENWSYQDYAETASQALGIIRNLLKIGRKIVSIDSPEIAAYEDTDSYADMYIGGYAE